MSVMCGIHKESHDTAAAVKACYAKKYAQAAKSVVAVVEAPKPTHTDCQSIPKGKYALEIGGKLRFFEVTVGKGRWEGHRFVEELFGAPGDWRHQKLLWTAQRATMRRILDDELVDLLVSVKGSQAGAARFGIKFTMCARCSSPLTDEKSRQRGLGPECVKYYI